MKGASRCVPLHPLEDPLHGLGPVANHRRNPACSAADVARTRSSISLSKTAAPMTGTNIEPRSGRPSRPWPPSSSASSIPSITWLRLPSRLARVEQVRRPCEAFCQSRYASGIAPVTHYFAFSSVCSECNDRTLIPAASFTSNCRTGHTSVALGTPFHSPWSTRLTSSA
jgi:hypothetical protein